jgi:hypothetical protein
MKITQTTSTFYVNQTGTFEIAGVENLYLYNKTTKLTPTFKEPLESKQAGPFITLTRKTHYGSILTTETYTWDSTQTNVESFPISHQINIINGTGMTLMYQVSKLNYIGTTRTATSPETFGKNMKITWENGSFYQKISNTGTLQIKYLIPSDSAVFNVRLFDPTIPTIPELSYWCYQEFTNVSSCGNAAVYNYSMVPYYVYMNYSFPSLPNLHNALWQVKWSANGGNPTNYSIPTTCFNYADTTKNLQLRLFSNQSNDAYKTGRIECLNSSGWNTIASDSTDAGGSANACTSCWNQIVDGNWDVGCEYYTGYPDWNQYAYVHGGSFFEEAIWWNLSTYQNTNAELGSLINISYPTSTTMCIDFNHPDYGTNYTCGTNLTFNANITYMQTTTLNDTNSSENKTYTNAPENKTYYLPSHQYDEVINLTINITTFNLSTSTPKNIRIFINNTLSNDFTTPSTINNFNDTNTVKNTSFTTSQTINIIEYIKIHKNSTVLNARMNLTGFNLTHEVEGNTIGGITTITATPSAYVSQNFTIPYNATLLGLSAYHAQNSYSLTEQYISIGTTLGGNDISYCTYYAFRSSIPNLTYCSTGNYVVNAGEQLFFRINSAVSTPLLTYASNTNPYSYGIMWDKATATPGSDLWFKLNATSYPLNNWMEIGSINGTRDWSNTGFLSTKQSSNNFTGKLNNFLASCTPDSNGYCYAPIYVYSESGGIIQASDLNVSLQASNIVNPIQINASILQNYLNHSINTTYIPIIIQSLENGTIQLNDIKYNYRGGNKTYTVLSHNTTYGNNQSYNITYFYSDWQKVLPRGVSYVEFIPSSPTAKNVTPYKQTGSIPIYNFTYTGYSNNMSNFTVKLNETYSCINWSINTANNKTSAILLNTTEQILMTNKPYLYNTGIWMWADYACNASSYIVRSPLLTMKACGVNEQICEMS